MSNPILLAADLSIPTYAWKTSAGADNVNSSYPVSNLKTYYPDQLSKANSTGLDQYFLIDLASAISCNACVVDGANIATAAADIKTALQTNTNDDTTWTDANDVDEFASSDSAQIITFNAQSKRYWRILYNSAAPLAAAPQIGNIYLGTAFEPGKTQDWEFTPGVPDFVTSKSNALDGRLRMAQSFGGFKRWNMKFSLLSDTVRTNWLTFLSTVRGDGRPFYYVDESGNVWCVVFEQSFNDIKARRYNLNDINQFSIRTVLANY